MVDSVFLLISLYLLIIGYWGSYLFNVNIDSLFLKVTASMIIIFFLEAIRCIVMAWGSILGRPLSLMLSVGYLYSSAYRKHQAIVLDTKA